jgi:hypothetical protein
MSQQDPTDTEATGGEFWLGEMSVDDIAASEAIEAGTLRWLLTLAPLLGIIAAAVFTIRGYSVSNNTLLIHRLFWNTQLSLQELRSVQSIPNAMRGGIRGFGNVASSHLAENTTIRLSVPIEPLSPTSTALRFCASWIEPWLSHRINLIFL